MATNKTYWRRRFKQTQDAIKNGAYKDAVAIEREYTAAMKEIDTKIRAWYQRIAENNEISYEDAVKLLRADELDEFHWTVDEYIKHGIDNLDGAWSKQLENASARVHISRLEALKIELQGHAEELTGKLITTTTNAAEEAFTASYYHTAYELQHVAGVGVDMQQIDKRQLEKVLSKPWTPDKKTFKAKCWENKDKLVNTLHKELTRMVATGAKPDQAIENISKAFETSKANAARLVMTESAYFSSEAERECFSDLGVKRFQVLGTFDTKMCAYCADMDGTIAPMSEFKAGVTAPPFHPWCRCCTIPYYEELKDIGQRAMRDPETGKGAYVPKEMTYKEWKEIYVDKTSTMDDWNKKHGK